MLSPTPNTGKTTVLRVLKSLVPDPEFLIDPTAAALRMVMSESTVLLNEIDNVRIGSLVAILNNGYQKGGFVPRVIDGVAVKWSVFAPVALAGIGTLPPALISRSIIIRMYGAERGIRITRLDINNAEQMHELALINADAAKWAGQVNLNTDPPMPRGCKGRVGDNWRVLFAIADSLNRGDIARKAGQRHSRPWP